jgi:aminodeoxyfutalosine synthase
MEGVTTSLETISERVANGEALSEADARAILETNDLIAIGMMADDLRRRMHGNHTTFVRVFEIHVDAPPASLTARLSAGELRIVGTPQTIEAAVSSVKAAATLAGGLPVTGFSLADLMTLAARSEDLQTLCARLREAGLEALAEVPLDLIEDPDSAVTVVRNAGLAAPRLIVHALTDEDRIPIVRRASALQQAVGGFRAFAPLPRLLSVATPTTGYDDVKQVALARLIATNIDSIQVDWVNYGPKLAQVALTVGADDVDGIAAVDPGILGTRRSPIEEIRGNIHAAGLEPIERDGRFEVRA